MKKTEVLAEYCDDCEAEPGVPCKGLHEGFHDERWRRAHETAECLAEDLAERRRESERGYERHGRF